MKISCNSGNGKQNWALLQKVVGWLVVWKKGGVWRMAHEWLADSQPDCGFWRIKTDVSLTKW